MIWGGWDRIPNALAGLYFSNCRAVHWHCAQFTEFSQGSDKKVLWAIINFTSLFSYSFQINSFRLKWLQVHHLPHHQWWSKHAQTWNWHYQKVEASQQSSSAVSFLTITLGKEVKKSFNCLLFSTQHAHLPFAFSFKVTTDTWQEREFHLESLVLIPLEPFLHPCLRLW